LQLRPTFIKGVGNVFQKDEAEDDVLVLGGIHAGPKLIGCGPESLLEVLVHQNPLFLVDEAIVATVSVASKVRV
jgi:hypothetical protein